MDFSTILYNLSFGTKLQGLKSKINYYSSYVKEDLLHFDSRHVYEIIWKGLKIRYINTIGILRNEIIQNKLYDVKFDKENPVIIDAGFNNGYFTLYMKANHPKSTIYAFEPNPVTFEFGKKNIEINQLNKVHLYNKGVLDKDKKMTFYVQSGAPNEKN